MWRQVQIINVRAYVVGLSLLWALVVFKEMGPAVALREAQSHHERASIDTGAEREVRAGERGRGWQNSRLLQNLKPRAMGVPSSILSRAHTGSSLDLFEVLDLFFFSSGP